jgi:hypothetical protein
MKQLTIYTHNGTPHADEMWACAALYALDMDRELTVNRILDSDLEEVCKTLLQPDEEIWVLDVGGVYDPIRRMIDHHQDDPQVNNECTLSLLVGHIPELGVLYTQSREFRNLVDRVRLQDTKGAKAILHSKPGETNWAPGVIPAEWALLADFADGNAEPAVELLAEWIRQELEQVKATGDLGELKLDIEANAKAICYSNGFFLDLVHTKFSPSNRMHLKVVKQYVFEKMRTEEWFGTVSIYPDTDERNPGKGTMFLTGVGQELFTTKHLDPSTEGLLFVHNNGFLAIMEPDSAIFQEMRTDPVQALAPKLVEQSN